MDPIKEESNKPKVIVINLPQSSATSSHQINPRPVRPTIRLPAASASQSSSNAAQSRAPLAGSTPGQDPDENFEDFESRKGIFGYLSFSAGLVLPHIFRKGVKYCSVKMAEEKILHKYFRRLPSEIHSCYSIKSHFVHPAEYKLLNEINLKHNDGFFGKEFFTSKDLIVKQEDVIELLKFLQLCYKKLVMDKSEPDDRCGFLKINDEGCVPYIYDKNVKLVPLFYFEGQTDSQNLDCSTCSGWDMAYIKLCCKIQGIRSDLFSDESCKVISLDEIKQHFPSDSHFEDYWPKEKSIGSLPLKSISPGFWVKKPPPQPVQQPGAPPNIHPSKSGFHVVATRPSNPRPPRPSGPTVIMKSNYNQPVRIQVPKNLLQINEFLYDRSLPDPPYTKYYFLVENSLLCGYNLRPHDKGELFVPLPELAIELFPNITHDILRAVLTQLGINLYNGNSEQIATLRRDPKYAGMSTIPLMLAIDLVTKLPTIKQSLYNSRPPQPIQATRQVSLLVGNAAKRPRLIAKAD